MLLGFSSRRGVFFEVFGRAFYFVVGKAKQAEGGEKGLGIGLYDVCSSLKMRRKTCGAWNEIYVHIHIISSKPDPTR